MDNDSDEYIKARKIQRMARDLIDIKRTEFTLLIPRHILHEDDEHFVVQQHFQTNPKRQSIPPRLMMIPRDANFLVEVFFEHAYFYYPVLNRAVVELCLMDSHTPHSMLLLNTVFMVACKHLPRTEDTMRAIEFRERVRELRWYVGYTEDRTRLTALLGEMLGFMAVYGLFGITPGHMEFCATHRTLGRKSSGAVLIDHDAEFLRGEVERGRFAEVPYQNRLWLFWAHYLRDSIAKLYFGYEYGIDAKPMTAELPRIQNFIGLGGGASSPSAQRSESHSVALTTGTTRKRRETSHSRGPYLPDKRFLSDPEAQGGGGAGSDRRPKFRGSDSHCNEETDSSEDEVDGLSQIPVVTGGPNSFTRPISVLSKEILEAQSRGDSALHKSTDSAGSLDPAALTAHMERMEVLLRSQEDATDNGSYARALFLEEIKLWTIGRRLSAYLASRVAGKASPCSAGLMGHTPNDSTPASAFHSTLQGGVGKWSEQEWLQDQELQNLQADLIAWEKAIPEHLRFRQDVDHSDVNHKVNGKVSIIMMSYYTITIMLQTSYLPDLSDMPRSKKSSPQVPPPNQDGPRSRLDSRGETDSATTTPQNRSRSTSSVSKDATTAQLSNNNSNNNNIAQPTSSASSRNTLPLPTAGSATAAVTTDTEDEFFNTAHRICTELSNVLLHHVEIMLDRYPHWCSIQAKVNHALIAAQRVTCLNARFNRNSAAIRDEAKAGFKMGSELYKRLALLPAPLVIHDRPPVEDVKYMNDLEKEFQQMVVGQEEERGRKEQQEHSQSQGVQEEDQSQVQGQDTLLDAFVLEADNQAPPMNDSAIEINPQGLNIFGGEETEGYAFEFETIPVSMKDSFSFLLDPHTLTE
ncbi:hypothetical protein BGX33_009641 [Mortierella sp. NVP41]|nr:hypothetical protein BGX33_009641 [Mortierella sp. NVP41]